MTPTMMIAVAAAVASHAWVTFYFGFSVLFSAKT